MDKRGIVKYSFFFCCFCKFLGVLAQQIPSSFIVFCTGKLSNIQESHFGSVTCLNFVNLLWFTNSNQKITMNHAKPHSPVLPFGKAALFSQMMLISQLWADLEDDYFCVSEPWGGGAAYDSAYFSLQQNMKFLMVRVKLHFNICSHPLIIPQKYNFKGEVINSNIRCFKFQINFRLNFIIKAKTSSIIFMMFLMFSLYKKLTWVILSQLLTCAASNYAKCTWPSLKPAWPMPHSYLAHSQVWVGWAQVPLGRSQAGVPRLQKFMSQLMNPF
ncbi:putative signal peptide protein [Puccinia sorghi]|uniref:Putative signal peptide protein n=1 Tax=Puccinia sorghi TaxID=27349 RepID=A0A0L6UFV0_9BASI|nr:putative signal peptide protein [Puccinia sorghi]